MAISHRSKEEEKRFAELHCISNHSFLRGASHPGELVKQAALLGYQAIAITDECSFSGLVKAHIAAKKYSIKLIIGSEFWIEEGFIIILLAPDKEAYEQLSALISKLRCRSQKGSYHATLADFNSGLNRCLALWVPPINSFQLLRSLTSA